MQFATPPKITLSHWLLFLGYVPFLELRLVLKVSVKSHPGVRPTSVISPSKWTPFAFCAIFNTNWVRMAPGSWPSPPPPRVHLWSSVHRLMEGLSHCAPHASSGDERHCVVFPSAAVCSSCLGQWQITGCSLHWRKQRMDPSAWRIAQTHAVFADTRAVFGIKRRQIPFWGL